MPRLHIASWELAQGVLSHPVAGPKITHVISINDPDGEPPPALGHHGCRRLVLYFHDVSEPSIKLRSPSKRDVADILRFGDKLDGRHQVLVHCAAGISRSSAAALALVASKLKPSRTSALEAVRHVMAVKQTIHPNELMVGFADELLGYRGALVEAHASTFRGGGLLLPGLEDAADELLEDE